MLLSKIVYTAISIGVCLGICMMMISNGLLGTAETRDVVGTILILGSISLAFLIRLIIKIKPVWLKEI